MEYSGANQAIFRTRTEALVRDVFRKYALTGGGVRIQDQGALEVTLRARLETALERAMEARVK
jgi:citrate lyase subunit gamma (acyl carrier protein)